MAHYGGAGQYYDRQQQQQQGYGGPYGRPGDVNGASTYSVNNDGLLAHHADDHGQHAGDPGMADMYDDGERSPLTANAQYPAGYPPHFDHGLHSQASFLGKDPYMHEGNGLAQSMGYLPPAGFNDAGFARPGYSTQNSRTDSDVEWQRRARMPTRGKTTKIKLKQGNFIHEYPVPSPIRNSVEAKWMTMCECASANQPG